MAPEDTNATAAGESYDGANATNSNNTDTPPPGDISENNEGPMNHEFRTAVTPSENFTVPASAVERAPTSVKCKFLPHGVYAVIPALFSMMAWFACLSKDGCDYARVTGPIVADVTKNPSAPYFDAGFNHYREPTLNSVTGEWDMDSTSPCREYNTAVLDIDAAWEFAKVASFLSLVLGGGGALFIWFSSCFVFRKNTWRWAGYELLGATISLILSYTWFATNLCHGNDGQDKCSMHYGARADILACALWAASALLIFCKYPAEVKSNAEASNPIQHSPIELEMSDQSGERRVGAATDEHEII